MPIFVYECRECGIRKEFILKGIEPQFCESCGRQLKQIVAAANFHIAGNPGPKLRTRVNLDDELQRQGFKAPLFRSEEAKDKARWALKKHSLG